MATNSVLRNLVGAVLVTGIVSGPVMAFETSFDINFGDLTEGTVVNTQYSAAGVTISALNKSAQSGGKPSYAVVYDPSNPSGGNGLDPDLEQSFNDGGDPQARRWNHPTHTATYSSEFTSHSTAVSLSNSDKDKLNNPGPERKLLIVQNDANYAGCDVGTCTTPNDEANNHNFLIFDFEGDGGVTLSSIDLFDIDGGNQAEEARFAFFLDGNDAAAVDPASHGLFSQISTLDNTVDGKMADGFFTVNSSHVGATGAGSSSRFFFGNGIENVRRLVVGLKSSGAVTGLSGNRTTVPEPGTLLLLAAGFAGMVRLGRQRSAGA